MILVFLNLNPACSDLKVRSILFLLTLLLSFVVSNLNLVAIKELLVFYFVFYCLNRVPRLYSYFIYMIITLKNFIIPLGSLLLTCGGLSCATEGKVYESSPAGQFPFKKRDLRLNVLPLELFEDFLESSSMADSATKNVKERDS